jgi:hypothetical protein
MGGYLGLPGFLQKRVPLLALGQVLRRWRASLAAFCSRSSNGTVFFRRLRFALTQASCFRDGRIALDPPIGANFRYRRGGSDSGAGMHDGRRFLAGRDAHVNLVTLPKRQRRRSAPIRRRIPS